jgi:hypothetical protein
MKHSKLYEWVEESKEQRITVHDDSSWRPSTITCVEVKEQVDQRIRNNLRISTDETISNENQSCRNICKNGLRPKRKQFILLKSRKCGPIECTEKQSDCVEE